MKYALALAGTMALAPPAHAETAIDFRQLPKPLAALLKVTPDCSPLDNVVMEQKGVSRLHLADGTDIYRVPCWQNEANDVQRYFTIVQDVATPLLFAAFTDTAGWTGAAEMFNSRLDETTGDLTAAAKPDASGTCGSTGHWRWRGGAFHLIELRVQPACSGDSAPAQWPIVYSAKEP